jgi:hypothetical protein
MTANKRENIEGEKADQQVLQGDPPATNSMIVSFVAE